MSKVVNIASRLSAMAAERPFQRAIIQPVGKDRQGRVTNAHLTFQQLDEETNRIAAGLLQRGLKPGMKLVLFVPFSIEFIELTFALFKAGAVIVLIDPGMGRTNIFKCLEEVDPDGFVAINRVHAIRWLYGKRFPNAKFNISVGGRFPGVVANFEELRQTKATSLSMAQTRADDRAAVIFTSGSTGPPKGVEYEHGMFDAQVSMIRDQYGIEAGEIDLPGFPLFGLFNAAMGVTTVIPDMDPTKPAQVDPQKIIQAIEDHGVTQAFGSPAFWNRVGRYCIDHGVKFPSIRRALSAGGPVPTHVLQRMGQVLTREGADLYTPYGATESLPVASIGGQEVLSRMAERTSRGEGTCVGRIFAGVDVKIVKITDGPITSLADAKELPQGEVGEIIIRSPSVTKAYFQRPDGTALAKIQDGDSIWHRIGDVGYFDKEGLLWFCGRKAHIVDTPEQRLFSVCCEAIFNNHPRIYRSALVGIGETGKQVPAMICEPEPGEFPASEKIVAQLKNELLELAAEHVHTQNIKSVYFHPSLPVDTRHNVKINREALAEWVKVKK